MKKIMMVDDEADQIATARIAFTAGQFMTD